MPGLKYHPFRKLRLTASAAPAHNGPLKLVEQKTLGQQNGKVHQNLQASQTKQDPEWEA